VTGSAHERDSVMLSMHRESLGAVAHDRQGTWCPKIELALSTLPLATAAGGASLFGPWRAHVSRRATACGVGGAIDRRGEGSKAVSIR